MTDSFGGHLETMLIDVGHVKHLLAEVERLVAELLESNSIISRDAKQIFTLGEQAKHLQAEVERLRAAFGPTIELLKAVEKRLTLVEQWDFDGYGEPYNSVVKELARLKAIVEKGAK